MITMKVAFLTMGNDIGGAKNDVITLSTELSHMGHEVYVLSAPGVMDKELAGTGVNFIPAPFYTRSPWGLFKASRLLRRIIREHEIELVNPQGMFTAAIAWMSKFGFHSNHCAIITTIHMISSLKLYKWSWTLNTFSNRIITESNCERNRLVAGGVHAENIVVINNSVDMERFSRENSTPVLRKEYSLDEQTPAFGLIARLSPEKRHCDFIKAAELVHEKYPSAHFFIVGDGPCHDEVYALAKGKESYLHLTGARRDIPDILHSLTCFVLNSKVESLPLSIREAMSMKLPVIVTDVGGNREAVVEGVNGWVVPPCQPEKLAERMCHVIENPEESVKMGEEGRRFCRLCFELHNWGRKTEAAFRKMLGQ